MDISREWDYYYCKLYLYPPAAAAGMAHKPFGTAEIEIAGRRGRLICRPESSLWEISQEYSPAIFPVMLSRADDTFYIGHFAAEPPGEGLCRWEFNTAEASETGIEGNPVTYRILVMAGPFSENSETGERKVLLEGRFCLNSELRDNRIVGFMKEAKVKNRYREAGPAANPLFRKVEPFEPPIPNCSWWQISIQPNIRSNYWQDGYCPRQKSYKAIY